MQASLRRAKAWLTAGWLSVRRSAAPLAVPSADGLEDRQQVEIKAAQVEHGVDFNLDGFVLVDFASDGKRFCAATCDGS